MTYWLDVDDLIVHLTRFGRPSGIQRVVFEIGSALKRLGEQSPGGEDIQFLRRGHDARNFRIVDWSEIETLFHVAMQQSSTKTGRVTDARKTASSSGLADDANTLRHFWQTQGEVLKALSSLIGTSIHHAARARRRKLSEASSGEKTDGHASFANSARAGDIFLTLGSPWHHDDYIDTILWVRNDLRMLFGLLMYDIVPVRHPEWCDRQVVSKFEKWHRDLVPQADMIFAISDATAADVHRYLIAQNIGAPAASIHTIPLGTSFGLSDEIAPVDGSIDADVTAPYVLFVSTIEVRKNHILLFKVWQRLLAEMPRQEVPTLVFAGREGWLVADLLQQLDNVRWLDGKIRFVRNPNDAALQQLYANCSFTVFPSFFEGWGLPVTESLSMGRPCIASNTTSLPEAGGDLARYFNPYDLNDAYRVIRAAIEDKVGLADWTRKVREHFTPIPWSASAQSIIDAFANIGE